MNCFCSGQLKPIYKGDDATIRMIVMHEDGSKMNFKDKTIKFIVKKEKSEQDSEAVIFKTLTPTTDTYLLEIELTDTDTNIDPRIYWWGVRVDSDGYQVTEGEGRLEIKQGAFYGK